MFVLIASVISWSTILIFLTICIYRVMMHGGFRRVAMHLRERALKRPANDPLHRFAIFTFTVEASWWKAAERRKWGRKGMYDEEDDETAQLVEEGYRLVEAEKKSRSSSGDHSSGHSPNGQRRSKDRPSPASLRHGSMAGPHDETMQCVQPMSLPDAWGENSDGTKGPPLAAKPLLGKWRTVRTENYEVRHRDGPEPRAS